MVTFIKIPDVSVPLWRLKRGYSASPAEVFSVDRTNRQNKKRIPLLKMVSPVEAECCGSLTKVGHGLVVGKQNFNNYLVSLVTHYGFPF